MHQLANGVAAGWQARGMSGAPGGHGGLGLGGVAYIHQAAVFDVSQEYG